MSEEQLRVVDACALGNCVVDSVAGSGKTTTCLLIAQSSPETNLLLTYNAKLKLDTRARVLAKGITNMEVHSYHSFCVKFYDPTAYDDLVLKQIVSTDVSPKPFHYSRIILDETQDMTPMLYGVFRKIFKDNGDARICVLGDQKQSIYEFRKADARFLTLAPNIFPGKWTRLSLTTTYRLTIPMADFVNKVMLNEERLVAVKDSRIRPEYIICNAFSNSIFIRVMALLKIYTPEDIFLVAPSVRAAKSPLRELENKLVKMNVPCFAPINDEEVVCDDMLSGKIALSTIHQTKGMERKVVIVFGFDDSYFKFYKRDVDPRLCPNELYVAATRATERLYLVHHCDNGYLPFLQLKKLKPYVTSENTLRRIEVQDQKSPIDSVTSLLRHLESSAVHNAYAKLTRTTLVNPDDPISIDSKITGDTVESVSHITGTAIPIYFESKVRGKTSILKKLKGEEDFGNLPRYNHMGFLCQAHKHPIRGLREMTNPVTTQELLFVVNCWMAETGGYISQVKQIQKYDWLSPEILEECCSRIQTCLETISMTAEFFEKPAMKPPYAVVRGATNADVEAIYPDPFPELKRRVLCGYADVVGSGTVLEIKCVLSLKMEHYLQLALYMYLNDFTVGYLFNVLTGELVKVECPILADVVALIIDAKFNSSEIVSDEEFIRKFFMA